MAFLNKEVKKEFPARKPVLCKGKACQGTEKQGGNGSHDGGEHAVEGILSNRNHFKQALKVCHGGI